MNSPVSVFYNFTIRVFTKLVLRCRKYQGFSPEAAICTDSNVQVLPNPNETWSFASTSANRNIAWGKILSTWPSSTKNKYTSILQNFFIHNSLTFFFILPWSLTTWYDTHRWFGNFPYFAQFSECNFERK